MLCVPDPVLGSGDMNKMQPLSSRITAEWQSRRIYQSETMQGADGVLRLHNFRRFLYRDNSQEFRQDVGQPGGCRDRARGGKDE